MALLPSAPIDQFDEALTVQPNDFSLIYQVATGKTMKTKSSNFGIDSPSSNYNWSSTFDYPLDDIVEYQGKLYRSLQTPNVGNIPNASGSAYWEVTVKSTSSTLSLWAPGIYIDETVFVMYDLNQDDAAPNWGLYALKEPPTRPFTSTDFPTELAAGDWALVAGGIQGADNGLAILAGKIGLGGTLVRDTAITGAGKDLDISGLAVFQVKSGDPVTGNKILMDDGSGPYGDLATILVAGDFDGETTPYSYVLSDQNQASLYAYDAATGKDAGVSVDNQSGKVDLSGGGISLNGNNGVAGQVPISGGAGNTVWGTPVVATPGLGAVLATSNNAGALELINAANATAPQSLTPLAQVQALISAAVTGLFNDRGNYDASVNAYPSSGGSGGGGAILKGDIWTITVAGTLPTGQAVVPGATVRALINTPGNTQANWGIDNDVLTPWSPTTIGGVEQSVTAEAQNIVARALAGSSNASNSDARTPSEKGLVEMLLSFIGTAWNWTAQQTLAIGPIITDGTASVPVMFSASKKLVANAFAVLADFVTGTDNVKQVTVAGLLSHRNLKRQACSVVAAHMTIDLAGREEAKYENTTPVTADFEIDTLLNAGNLEILVIIIYVTGTIYIKVPSTCVMELIDDRWNNTLKKVQVDGGTASPVTLSFSKMNALIDLRVGFAQYSS
jgi:hypothetical protein